MMTTPRPKKSFTFERICELEPEIFEIYTAARTTKNRASAAQLWRSNWQPRLGTLVGLRARKQQLRNYDSFALTMDTVAAALKVLNPSSKF